MAKQSIVPFGPQHPVLPEPIHLDLVLEDEKILVFPRLGKLGRQEIRRSRFILSLFHRPPLSSRTQND